MIGDLTKLGFKNVGRWELTERYKSGINMILSQYEDQRVIYCFVVDSVLKYIGVVDSYKRTLKNRMVRYRSRTLAQKYKSGTSLEINLKIKECLEKGRAVDICALKPKNNHVYKKLEVDLVRGLEYPLINKFDTPWNKNGKK